MEEGPIGASAVIIGPMAEGKGKDIENGEIQKPNRPDRDQHPRAAAFQGKEVGR
jgi:hypothetical protein